MKNFFILIFWLIISCYSYGLTNIPPFNSDVIDTSGTLTASQRSELESYLYNFENTRTDGAQIVVLMIAKLDDETIEQYAVRVFEKWKIGARSRDNGVLLLIAKENKRMHIEVGMGLQGSITDLIADNIIQNQLKPQFKQNNYYQGIKDTLSMLVPYMSDSLPEFVNNQDASLNTIVNSEFGQRLLNYGMISFAICFFLCLVINLIFGLKSSMSSLKQYCLRILATGVLNGLSVGGFTFCNGYSLLITLKILLITCLGTMFLCVFVHLRKSNSSRGGGNFTRRGGGSGSSNRSSGGFRGGGGGRSNGGGASGSW